MIRIAAHNSSASDIARADLVCDGVDDQVEINQALAVAGAGRRFLYAGEYILNKDTTLPVNAALGLTQSNTVLCGEGDDTKLLLQDEQKCNVIRGAADGLTGIQIRDLFIDPNGVNNQGEGTDWYEIAGVNLRSSATTPYTRCGVDNVTMKRSHGVGVWTFGDDMFVINSRFGGSDHDVVELCSGSRGKIVGCEMVLESGEVAPYGFGTDNHNEALIALNTMTVNPGGAITDTAIRTWGACYRNQIIGNRIISVGTSQDYGDVEYALRTLGYMNIVIGNTVVGRPNIASGRTKVLFNAGTIERENVLNVVEVIYASTAPTWDAEFSGNFLNASVIPSSGGGLTVGPNFFV